MSSRPESGDGPAAAAPSPGWSGWLVAASVAAVGLVLRVWIFRHTSGLTMDSPLYVGMAAQLGHRLQTLGPAHHGYSALISLASLVLPGDELPGRMVSLVAGAALIVVTWRLAAAALPPLGAAVAAALVAFHPLLALSSTSVMTEASFQLLTYVALLIVGSGRVALGGATLGLAYCVRPEAAAIAVATTPWLTPARRRWLWILAFVLAALPEVILLSAEHRGFTVTAKPDMVVLSGAEKDDVEWRTTDAESLAAARRGAAGARTGEAVARAAARYPDRLAGTLARVHQMWPAPLLALSVIGAIARPGVLLAPLVILLVLPLVGVTPNLRYPQTMAPALAIYAVIGAAWVLQRVRRPRLRWAMAGVLGAMMALGLGWCWRGAAGDAVRRSEDGPMVAYRRAGDWLAANGRPGALIMDRKPYVPFFARMRRTPMPDDPYDALVTYAVRTGVDYVVVEEYLMWSIRKQFVPLMTDPAFRERETRLRMIYFAQDAPRAGVAIFEVVR